MQRLSLGLAADPDGLRDAEHTLRQVQRQLQRRQFSWDDWSSERSAAAHTDVDGAVASFEKAFHRSTTTAQPIRQPHHLDECLPALPETPAGPGGRSAARQ